ncbi:hypothetical protein IQ241_02300 [Romeria aff. gracilis LEGE 07310]|uniref:Uncharacterized protein n=1 Tax=Vasconcelosia minhoensis LEGE 07310 TaxID=915328 RepID=A0A8J7AK23_9CYAN|nr:hypothetical protein [Romeria gracilis]MBE9076134.1 hypothetical protein [Romeria aff. gracilis LEGE 07310]
MASPTAPKPPPSPVQLQAQSQAQSVTPLHLGFALVGTAAIAALIGMGFGSAVRFSLVDTPSAQFLNPQQTFPPLPNWPAKAGVAPFDTPYFPGADRGPVYADEDFYSEPPERETFVDEVEPFSADAYPTADDPSEAELGYSEYPEYPDVFEENSSGEPASPDYSSEDFFPAAPDPDKGHQAKPSNLGLKGVYRSAAGERKLGQL